MRAVFVLCVVTVAYGPTMDERQPTAPARSASYLNALTGASKTPGIQYVVVNAADVVFEYAGGWADIHRQVPVDAATTMMAYSMSKTITAVAALQLVEAGKVGLDDSVERYVDSLPYGGSVTVRQLIAHTSGIPNPIPLRWVHPAGAHGSFDEKTTLRAVLHDHRRLSFEPGTKYGYSNIGYWLLGQIVERAGGESFSAYVSEHILRPLGIAPHALGYVVADPAHHAAGYLEKYSLMNLAKGFLIDRDLIGDYSGRWLEIRSHYLNGPAFGGLVGTARAFGAFLQDQLREQSVLFNDTTRHLFYTPQQTMRGTPVAMTLFVERAATVAPTFALTPGNAATVVEICRRLDGIPLAIELAAARLNVLSVESINDRLNDRFRLLTGGSRTAVARQRTLEATVDWSYELLSKTERRLLCHLSVFAGGWTMDAAEAVCASNGIKKDTVLDLLSHLVDKSLVNAEQNAPGNRRYRFLETVRHYAREHLHRSGSVQKLRDRHLDFFFDLARTATPEVQGPNQAQWLNWLELEHDNLRAALEWCLTSARNSETSLRLVCALWPFWNRRNHFGEGRQWVERALTAKPPRGYG